jgi:sugar phosphate isomerase/epimerase
MTADLGANNLRVFLSWWGVTRHPQLATYAIAEGFWPIVHKEFSDTEMWGWCREALVECARYAGDYGVTLALQNHPPLIKDHHDLLRMVNDVGSPHLKLCLDAPLMKDKSESVIHAAAGAVGSLQVMSHFGGEFERLEDGSIKGVERNDGILGDETRQYYEDFASAMRAIDYQGYTSYELCHELPKVNGQTVGIEFAHKNARLAAEFMREIVEDSKRNVSKPELEAAKQPVGK